MNDSTFSRLEGKLLRAVQMPEPDEAFRDSLWNTLKSHSAASRPGTRQRLAVFTHRKAMAFSAGIVVIFLVVMILIGPQRVMAALQGVMGYLPGVGFVDLDHGLALRDPVEISRDGIVFRVEQLVASDAGVTLVVRVNGFMDGEQPGLSGVGLLANGYSPRVISQFTDITTSPGDYVAVYQFSPLPAGTREVDVLWNRGKWPTNNGTSAPDSVEWRISVSLNPVSDAEIAQLLPQSYQPAHSSNTQMGVTLNVDQVSTTTDFTAIRLETVFPTVFEYAYPVNAVLTDNLGQKLAPYASINIADQSQQVKPAPTTGSGSQQQPFLSLYQTMQFGPVNTRTTRFTLAIEQIEVSATTDKYVVVDLGDNPKIGQSLELNEEFSVGDVYFRVTRARLVPMENEEQSGAGLVLEIQPLDPAHIRLEQVWLFDDAPSGVSAFGRDLVTWTWMWKPDEIPTGVIEIPITRIRASLAGNWTLAWDRPES